MMYGRFQLLRGERSKLTAAQLPRILDQGVAFNLDSESLIFQREGKLYEIAGESVGSPPPGAMQGEVFQDMGSPGPQRTLICGSGKMLRFEGVVYLSGSRLNMFVPNDSAVYTEFTLSS